MKMNQTDFDKLKEVLIELDTPENKRIWKLCGFSHTAYRWKLFHIALKELESGFINNLYSYLYDSHIDTALRKILGNDF